ncbi:PEGA domain-containing protein [uncultured Deinococcus sp.]|uniref:PEGA domain-containing protein n=1 Tax=uncultured Deinococcus sp. TaxID=158789 RepID=UPI0025D113EC|nr:PEGA domain-containing protein [uncultured Deinococcus sp.]
MKTAGGSWAMVAALGGVLVACVPAPLRAQAGAQVHVGVRLSAPAVTTVTGETLYRPPGPGALLVTTDRAAYVSSLVLTAGQPVQVVTVGAVGAATEVPVRLPPTSGFTQVFTVASVVPLDVTGAQGARTLDDAGRAVQAAAANLPAGAYTVTTTAFTVGRFGTLRVVASVPGAEVRVDGRLAGYAPVTIPDVPVGSVTVSVSAPGLADRSQRVTVTENGVVEVRAVLAPITGTLSVSSDVPARVLVGGSAVGQVAGAGQPLRVKVRPGTVGVNVLPINPALAPQNLLVKITASQVTSIRCGTEAGAYTCKTP